MYFHSGTGGYPQGIFTCNRAVGCSSWSMSLADLSGCLQGMPILTSDGQALSMLLAAWKPHRALSRACYCGLMATLTVAVWLQERAALP